MIGWAGVQVRPLRHTPDGHDAGNGEDGSTQWTNPGTMGDPPRPLGHVEQHLMRRALGDILSMVGPELRASPRGDEVTTGLRLVVQVSGAWLGRPPSMLMGVPGLRTDYVEESAEHLR